MIIEYLFVKYLMDRFVDTIEVLEALLEKLIEFIEDLVKIVEDSVEVVKD